MRWFGDNKTISDVVLVYSWLQLPLMLGSQRTRAELMRGMWLFVSTALGIRDGRRSGESAIHNRNGTSNAYPRIKAVLCQTVQYGKHLRSHFVSY